MEASTVYETVDAKYSSIASTAHTNRAQAAQSTSIASSFGYSADDLALLPSGTNLGLSCGNPLATANLKPSETMLDLGSGGGLDCLLAAKKMLQAEASPQGRIFGIDRSENGLVKFVHAPITVIPLDDSSVDLVVSNCVINLVPDQDKPRVFREIYRLLKPGGRVAISDLLAKQPLPEHIRRDAALLVGCVAGASLVGEYHRWMVDAGFREDKIVFVNTGKDLNVYHDQDSSSSCCGDQRGDGDSSASRDKGGYKLDFNAWVASYQIYAVKGPSVE